VEREDGIEIGNRLPTEDYDSDATRRSRRRVHDLSRSRNGMSTNAKGAMLF